MKFIIPAHILGTKFSLLIKENNTFEKCYNNCGQYTEVNSDEFLEKIKLYGLELPIFLPEKFTNPYKQFIKNKEFIPWINCVPKELYKSNLKRYINEIKQILSQDFSYYDNVFTGTNNIFYNLFPANIDIEKYTNFITNEKNAAVSSVIKTFTPIKNNNNLHLTEEICYSRISSKTGRLTVTKGPQILHLKREYRKILKSRYKNGEIFYLDYKSLEPRILLSKTFPNKEIAKDIYQDALCALNLENKIDRKTIKTVLLSIINGAGEKEIVKQLSNTIQYPEDIIKLVIEFFGVDKLREQLLDEYKTNNGKLIYNHFNRPIICNNTAPYILLNYFIQSTAVDAAIIGFNNIVNKIIEKNLLEYIKPIFILHDALLLDVSPEIFPYMERIANVGSKIKKFDNIKFWIELERLNK